VEECDLLTNSGSPDFENILHSLACNSAKNDCLAYLQSGWFSTCIMGEVIFKTDFKVT